MKALLIVDVQNDFLPGGALPVPEGDRIIPVINSLQGEFELIVASKDWHPLDHVSFARTHSMSPGESIEVGGVAQVLWPVHCVEGTPGADFPPELNTDRITKTVLKGSDAQVDSYSAFFDNARLRSTGLHQYLQQQKVESLVVVGLATDYCVKYTVLDACELGYETAVDLRACRGIGPIEEVIKAMEEAGAKILEAQKKAE